jgi:hypothetical protein
MTELGFGKRSRTCIATLVGATALLWAAGDANAQEFLKDRRYQEGIGIRAGDFEFHPGIAGEVGYDSNWFMRSNKTGPTIANGEPTVPVIQAGLFRLTPSLTLQTLGQQRKEGDTSAAEQPKIAFRAGLSATYREFIGPQEVRDQRNLSANATARLDILPNHPWGFAIYGGYDRAIQPNTALSNPDNSFNRSTLNGGAEIIAIPGGGTLDWRAGYQLQAILFEDTNGVGFNNLTHDVYTKGRWKFRPRTAFLYDGTLRFITYTQPERSATTLLNDSTPVRARLGLNGLVTSRLALLGMVGWGSSFYRPGSANSTRQFDSVIAQAEAKFFLTANPTAPEENASVSLTLSSLALGYVRDFQNSYLGNYYGSDRGYAKIAYMFAGRLLLSLEGGVAAINYPQIFFPGGAPAPAPAPPNGFTDLRADGTFFGEYRFTNTFGINTTLRYTANISDTQLPLAGATGTTAQVYDMNYRRFEAFLGARWFL